MAVATLTSGDGDFATTWRVAAALGHEDAQSAVLLNAAPATITGTDGDDILAGTAGDDVIDGLSGNDTIRGGQGADTIRGGDNDDNIDGEAGNDIIEGGNGRDYIKDGAGDDMVDAGAGDDGIYNDSGNDVLRGGSGLNTFDIYRFGGGIDHVEAYGGDDSDRVRLDSVGASSFKIDLGGGADRIDVTFIKGFVELTLGAGMDVVALSQAFGSSIGPGSIAITDFQVGEAGDRIELLDFMARGFTGWNHTLSPFATGHVRLVQNGADAILQFDINGGGNNYSSVITFRNTSAAAFTPNNLDGYLADGSLPPGRTVTGTNDADLLYGAASGDTIDGLDGRDIIRGGGGNDIITGGPGQDDIFGEVGDDRIDGGAGQDYIDGGYGGDLIHGDDGDDYISSSRGVDTLHGDDGNDQMFIERGSLTTEIVTAYGGTGADTIFIYSYGSSTFNIDGGADADTIRLTTLRGVANVTLGGGRDTLSLSNHEPLFLVDFGSVAVADFEVGSTGDILDFDLFLGLVLTNWDGSNPFGSGHLSLDQSGADAVLRIDANGGGNGYRTIVTFKNTNSAGFTPENLDGYARDGSPTPGQTIIGDDVNEVLTGTAGADVIEGRGGNDEVSAGSSNDIVRGGTGADRLYGETGNDQIFGEEGADTIDGGLGSDLLDGGDGDDFIYDDYGSDTIDGGAGDDRIQVQRFGNQADSVAIRGGAGADTVTLSSYGPNSYTLDAGDGDDSITIGALLGGAVITLGSGSDIILLRDAHAGWEGGHVRITDFATGPNGDRIDLSSFLTGLLLWDPSSNPFATGHFRLVQSGANTRMELDRNGGGDAWTHLFTFENVSAASLTSSVLGYAPLAIYGTGNHDSGAGSAGNDVFRLEQGGNDVFAGNGGDDSFFFGAAFTAADRVDGGAGASDQIGLQGNYTGVNALVLASDTIRDVEAIAVLPGFSYSIKSDDNNLLAGQQLDVFAGNLAAGQSLYFDGASESDGHFRMFGGFGNDILIGGSQNDGFYFGPGKFNGNDLVLGGPGANDQLGLDGDYVITLGDNVRDIEVIALFKGPDSDLNSYHITTGDEIVSGGLTLTLFGTLAVNAFVFNGVAETDARFRIFGGKGGDTILGGALGDQIYGLGGADRITGGGGADIFVYTEAAESSGINFDQLVGFDHRVDRIDLPFAVTQVLTATGSASSASFDADLAAALGATLDDNAILFTANGGDLAGRLFAVIDANGVDGYQAGADYVIELAMPAEPVPPTTAIFV